VNILIGTSGWSYDHWRGIFYPRELPSRRWLEYYSGHFSTVETNSTFYRLPSASTVDRWAGSTPDGFVFAVKASRFITHIRRLSQASEPLSTFLETVSLLGSKLGPILFQLPPNFHADHEALEEFLKLVPRQSRVAFEFRHDSWNTPRTFELLEHYKAAWVIASSPDSEPIRKIVSDWTYLRFHGGSPTHPRYSEAELKKWAEFLLESGVSRGYAYFNNDAEGAAISDAHTLARLVAVEENSMEKP
jgi:uncharacterized protein YecE (DUF72 family)